MNFQLAFKKSCVILKEDIGTSLIYLNTYFTNALNIRAL